MKKILINVSIVLSVLAVCGGFYLVLNKETNEPLIATIHVDNVLVEEIDLSIVVEEYEKTIIVNGEEMIFLIGYNKIKVLEVCCPLEICKNQGFITLETEMIVCMPNKVVVSLTRGVS